MSRPSLSHAQLHTNLSRFFLSLLLLLFSLSCPVLPHTQVRYNSVEMHWNMGCFLKHLYRQHVSLQSCCGRWWLTIVVLQCQIITFSQWTSETAAIAPKPKQFTLMPALSVCLFFFMSGYDCSFSHSETGEVDRVFDAFKDDVSEGKEWNRKKTMTTIWDLDK